MRNFLLAVCLLFCVAQANAATYFYYTQYDSGTTVSSSASGACKARYSRVGKDSHANTVINADGTEGGCDYQESNNQYYAGDNWERGTCTAGSSGSAAIDGVCGAVPPPPPCIHPPSTPAVGPPLPGFFVGHSADANSSKPDGEVGNPFGKKQAFGECYVMPNGGSSDKGDCYSKPSAAGGRNFYCHLPAHYAEGSPNPQDPQGDMAGGAKENPGTCPKGTKQIGTDATGGEICGGSGTSDTAAASSDKSTSVANPNGSTTITTTNITNNTDGSVTTTTTNVTTNADGSKSTTSAASTKNPDGTQGKKDLPQSDFCSEHGDLNICNNSTVYGNCETVSCDGDAIQCAILQQNAKNVCENEKETDFSRIASAEFAKLPESGIVSNVDIGAKMRLDESGFLGGGACFADKTFAYMGQSLVVPFSRACDTLSGLRYVVLILAYVVGFRTVAGVVLRDM